MSSIVAIAAPDRHVVDRSMHSSIGFGVKHLGVSTFRGNFSGRPRARSATDDGALRAVEGKVRVENLVTEEPQLTGHLHSEDFFDADNHPEITFKSTSVEQAEDGKLRITGDLTIRGTPAGRARRRDRGHRRRAGRQHAGRHHRERRPRPDGLGHHLEPAARQRRSRRRRARHAHSSSRSRQAGLRRTVTQVQILAIPGSLRAGSWNAALLRLAQERAPEGVRVDIWDGLRHVPPFSEDHEGEDLAPPP